jgi:FixJ family two-component response regulator
MNHTGSIVFIVDDDSSVREGLVDLISSVGGYIPSDYRIHQSCSIRFSAW